MNFVVHTSSWAGRIARRVPFSWNVIRLEQSRIGLDLNYVRIRLGGYARA